MRDIAVVVLAAGKSTRMKSAVSKVLHPLAGRPVISYPLKAAGKCQAKRIVAVVSPEQADLIDYFKAEGVEIAIQKEAVGTANAVQAAEKALAGFHGDVLILCGDVPLINSRTLMAFVSSMRSSKAVLGVLTMTPPDPASYGRIIRDLDGNISRIVEVRDATEEEKRIHEVNSGILCADCKWLFGVLSRVRNNNAKGEYYLTDIVGLALGDGEIVEAFKGEPAEDFLGINTRVDLAHIAEILRERINKELMLAGVGILDFRHTYIDEGIKIGQDTTIMQHCQIAGSTKIGSGCTIEQGAILRDAVIGDGVHIKAYSVIEGSKVADGAVIGPFARLRPESKVGQGARVGNFVELKKCEMKKGAKANHLTYLGDAVVGAGANIGCGTITCNYDGFAKHMTHIGDGVFVGSDVQFIAPVRIGRGALIGAGSTITQDVPPDALALSRAPQKIVRGWVKRRRNSSKGNPKK